jgi:3-phosphoshikimate 1-carboxyvinyltransferase
MIRLFPPAHKINGTLTLAGSKSISNRWLILKHLFHSGLTLHKLSDSEDTVILQKNLGQIRDGTYKTIDVGHAGTNMRFLAALLAITPGSWLLTGSARMKERPVGALVNALRELGGTIEYAGKTGYPPLKIEGAKLGGGKIPVSGNVSSQFTSALLLIAPALENGLTISTDKGAVSQPYVDMTVSLLLEAGCKVERNGNLIAVSPFTPFDPKSVTIESDWSSASYWYSICALSKDAAIQLGDFHANSTQGDSIIPSLFSKLGVRTEFIDKQVRLTRVQPEVTSFNYDFTSCPDIAQTMAVTCFAMGIAANLTGLATLRHKETDRIEAVVRELKRAGARISATKNSISIASEKQPVPPPAFETYGDHRMAMSLAPLSFIFPGMTIADEVVVNKSYPRFWGDLLSVGFNVNLLPL